uniref:succinate dehydrogenase subunit 3 n=1 Tax=Microcos paniculata TaxID=197124 RepID=UPI003001BC84|nr:succinate dehydrogenase subunit 3 [Microcos paniculata]
MIEELLNNKKNIKRELNKTIKNEDKKECFFKFLDVLYDDLIRRANPNKNILRPLSPHLPIYKPQLTSTFPISHRISGAFLATIVLFFYLLCLKMGLIFFTYTNFYQFLFYSSRLLLISVEIAALALSYHLYNGVRHLLTDFSGFLFLRIGRQRLK